MNKPTEFFRTPQSPNTAMKAIYILPVLAMTGTIAAVCPLAAYGQELDKEITIDRDIVPAQRAAARPLVFPTVKPPVTTTVDLRMEQASQPAGITPGLTIFEPAQTVGAFPATPYRGYVDLGYFPSADFGLSAGYSIVEKEATRLNIDMQLDNRNYKSTQNSLWEGYNWKTLDLAVGLSFSQRIGRNTLRLATDIAFSSWSMPGEWVLDRTVRPLKQVHSDGETPDNLRWHIKAGFDGRANDNLTYGIGAGFGLFHNRKLSAEGTGTYGNNGSAPAVNQTSVDFNGYIRGNVSDNATLGFRTEGTFLNYNSFLAPELFFRTLHTGDPLSSAGGKTIGKIDLIPSAEYNGGNFYGKAGVRLGLSVNSGSTFHVAPDILLGINPASGFGAWLKFGGGVMANSADDLFNVSRYADTRLAYDLSNIAFTGQLGLRVGPFHGASLTLTLDYAAADNWLMPWQVDTYASAYNIFLPGRIRAWKAGGRIDWQYRRLLDVALSYEGTLGNGSEKEWLYWSDRARHVLGASISVHPLEPLSVNVGFSARLDRRQNVSELDYLEYINDQDYIQRDNARSYSFNLGDMTDLWAGVSWRFTPALTVFARFDNILGKRTDLIFNVPSQGFTGLFGAGYKF